MHLVGIEYKFAHGMTFVNEGEAYKAYAFTKGFGMRKGKKSYNRKNKLRGCTFLCCCEGYSEFAVLIIPHNNTKM